MKQTRIDADITLFTADQPFVNAVLIEYDAFLVCIDTLHLPADSKALSASILSRNKPLKYLINTHGHSDHCNGNKYLRQGETSIIIQDNYALTNRTEQALLKNVPSKVRPFKIIEPDITFTEELDIPECGIRIIHAPGHSPDASVIYLPNKKLVIAGDTLINSDSEMIAVPYFYWGDLDKLLSTLDKLLHLNVDLIIPGHGMPCFVSKIERDILYLRNFKKLMDEFLDKNHQLTVNQMKQTVFNLIGPEDCLPGTDRKEFWVLKMHYLNLERYIEWKVEGKCIETMHLQ